MSNRAGTFRVEFEVAGDGKARAAVKGLTDEVKASGSAAADAGADWEEFGARIGTSMKWAGAAVVGGLALIARNTMQAEQELAQLDAILKSTGNAAGFSRDQLVAMADELSKRSVFSGGEIIEAQTRLLSYSGILGENIPRAMQAVIDQSARLGISVTQSAETIGRALESPSKAAAALAQQGFGAAFTKEVRGTIDALVAAGREADAQVMILEILEESYGGAAQAARDSFGGSLVSLKNTLADLMTGSDGSLDGATESVNDLIDALNDPRVRDGFGEMVSGATAAVTALVDFVSWSREAYSAAQEWMTLQLGGNRAFGGENLAAQRRELQAINDELERRENAGLFTGVQLSRIGLTPRSELEASRARLQEAIALNEMLFGDPQGPSRIRLIDPTDPESMKIRPPAPVDTSGLDIRTDAERSEAAAEARKRQREEDKRWADQMAEIHAHEQVAEAARMDATNARLRRDEELRQAAERQREAAAALIEDLAFEASLIGMTNLEREKAIALRHAGADAASAEGQAIGELLDRIERGRMAEADMRFLEDAGRSLFGSIATGADNAGRAVDRFFDNLKARAADKFYDALLAGFTGMAGGGGWSGFASGFASAFGGGRAAGGGVKRGGMYEVLEGGQSELLKVNGKTILMAGDNGTVVPAQYASARAVGAGGDAPMQVVINNNGNNLVTAREERQRNPDGTEIKRLIVDVIAQDMSSGGRTWQAVKSRGGLREAGV